MPHVRVRVFVCIHACTRHVKTLIYCFYFPSICPVTTRMTFNKPQRSGVNVLLSVVDFKGRRNSNRYTEVGSESFSIREKSSKYSMAALYQELLTLLSVHKIVFLFQQIIIPGVIICIQKISANFDFKILNDTSNE